jgi:hypothetical protein
MQDTWKSSRAFHARMAKPAFLEEKGCIMYYLPEAEEKAVPRTTSGST